MVVLLFMHDARFLVVNDVYSMLALSVVFMFNPCFLAVDDLY